MKGKIEGRRGKGFGLRRHAPPKVKGPSQTPSRKLRRKAFVTVVRTILASGETYACDNRGAMAAVRGMGWSPRAFFRATGIETKLRYGCPMVRIHAMLPR